MEMVTYETLTETKRRFLESLEINETLQNMDAVIGELHQAQLYRLACDRSINLAKHDIEEIKALKIVNGEIVGKNEAERSAAMTIALQNDEDYNAARGRLDDAENEAQQTEANVEALRARITALRYRARLIAAQLEYLAD